MILKSGAFIRVKKQHPTVIPSRWGKDGMVLNDVDTDETDGQIPLTFGYDRYCDNQHLICVGPELWHLDELDVETYYE